MLTSASRADRHRFGAAGRDERELHRVAGDLRTAAADLVTADVVEREGCRTQPFASSSPARYAMAASRPSPRTDA